MTLRDLVTNWGPLLSILSGIGALLPMLAFLHRRSLRYKLITSGAGGQGRTGWCAIVLVNDGTRVLEETDLTRPVTLDFGSASLRVKAVSTSAAVSVPKVAVYHSRVQIDLLPLRPGHWVRVDLEVWGDWGGDVRVISRLFPDRPIQALTPERAPILGLWFLGFALALVGLFTLEWALTNRMVLNGPPIAYGIGYGLVFTGVTTYTLLGAKLIQNIAARAAVNHALDPSGGRP